MPLLALKSPWEFNDEEASWALVVVLSPLSMAAANPIDLAGTEWALTGDVGKAARFIQFRSDGRVTGYSGCNRFTGTYIQDGGTLIIGTLATTRMACPPEVMKREQEFLALLGKIRHVDRANLQLILKDGEGNVLAELMRRDLTTVLEYFPVFALDD